jgi:hypothetical protein
MIHGSRAAIFTELDARRNLWAGHVWVEAVGEVWSDKKYEDRSQARAQALDWFKSSKYASLPYSLEGRPQPAIRNLARIDEGGTP